MQLLKNNFLALDQTFSDLKADILINNKKQTF